MGKIVNLIIASTVGKKWGNGHLFTTDAGASWHDLACGHFGSLPPNLECADLLIQLSHF